MSEINLHYEVVPNSQRECRFCRTRIMKGSPILKSYVSRKYIFICETCVDNMKEMYEVAKLKEML